MATNIPVGLAEGDPLVVVVAGEYGLTWDNDAPVADAKEVPAVRFEDVDGNGCWLRLDSDAVLDVTRGAKYLEDPYWVGDDHVVVELESLNYRMPTYRYRYDSLSDIWQLLDADVPQYRSTRALVNGIGRPSGRLRFVEF